MVGMMLMEVYLADLKAVSAAVLQAARPSSGGMPRMSMRTLSLTMDTRASTLPAVSAAIQRCQRAGTAAVTAAGAPAAGAAAVWSAGLAQAAIVSASAKLANARRANMHASGVVGQAGLCRWGAIEYV